MLTFPCLIREENLHGGRAHFRFRKGGRIINLRPSAAGSRTSDPMRFARGALGETGLENEDEGVNSKECDRGAGLDWGAGNE